MSTSSPSLSIQTHTLGQWMTNCYVVSSGGECWIVDAGFEPQPMLDAIEASGLTPTQVILTHGHLDHIAGLWTVRERYSDLPILIHRAEKDFLTDTILNLSAAVLEPVIAPEATRLLKGGEMLELNGLRFDVVHTPGHSPGGISLIEPAHKLALVGDTLFAGSVGRYDFPTSDGPQLFRSIREQLLTLDDRVRVLPGHGPETSIGRERQSNPFLRDPAEEPGGLVG
ncbi:MAG: MBL fold metallo-hydrolase [Planctomycetota bacterium]